MAVPVPLDEALRLATLRGLDLLDTRPEPAFDEICRQAKTRFDVPIALISLVDADRQWFKAACGLGVAETPREHAFCAHALGSDRVMVVPDARHDRRFSENPLVTGFPFIVFYAGAPLVYGRGVRLGTLCVIDTRRRDFGEAEMADLAELADRVSGEIWGRQVGAESA